jgi:lipopolysaccharide export system permease protein
VLEIFGLNRAWLVGLAIPMAVLAATLMAFGRLSADTDITAAKAAGISPIMLMRPVLLVSCLIMMLVMLFNDRVLPEMNHRATELMQSISRKKPSAFIEEGKLITDFAGVQMWINRIDPGSSTLYGIQIFELDGSGPPRTIVADSAFMEYIDGGATLMLRLRSGENHFVDSKDPSKYFRIHFASQDFAIQNVDASFDRRERKVRGDREMSVEMMLEVVQKAKEDSARTFLETQDAMFVDMRQISALLKTDTVLPHSLRAGAPVLDTAVWKGAASTVGALEQERKKQVARSEVRLEAATKRIAQYEVEIHKKFSTAVACLVFALIGAPLGILARRGGIGPGTVYSLGFFVVYWVCLVGGENLADRLLVPAWLAMWASNILIGAFALVLNYLMWRRQ